MCQRHARAGTRPEESAVAGLTFALRSRLTRCTVSRVTLNGFITTVPPRKRSYAVGHSGARVIASKRMKNAGAAFVSSVLRPGTLRHELAASGCIWLRASGRTPAPAITACAAAGQGAGGVADRFTKVFRFSTQVLVAQMNLVVSA